MIEKKKRKQPDKIGVPRDVYRAYRRREEQLMKAKAYIREAWRILSKIKKAE